jgi:peptidoglycan/xylan/chitin deacetylase (PgdA/CDA1 family)
MAMYGKKSTGRLACTLWGIAGGLVVVSVIAVSYFTVFTVSVSIDGRPMRIDSSASVGNLLAKSPITGRSGDLVAVLSGEVLKAGGGGKPYAVVNGHAAVSGVRLRDGDVVTTHDGADTVEPILERTETTPFDVSYVGHGPVETIETTGEPGVRIIRYGADSKEVVSRETVELPVAEVIRCDPPPKGAKLVALTFDDGPWPGQTAAILHILEKAHIRATFFEIGRQARQHPGLSRMLAKAGMLIGNHTETHPLHLDRLTAAAVAKEITQAENDITRAAGTRPRYFRPPGGNTSPAMYHVLAKLRMKWVEWNVDPDDWQRPPTATIVARVMRGVRPGAVVLMHDGGGDRSHTIVALPIIIAELKVKGYVFVTLDGLPRLPHVMGW